MTRWARTKSGHRHEKLPSDATPWSKLKPSFQNSPIKTKDHHNEVGFPNKNKEAESGDRENVSMMKFKGTNHRHKSETPPTPYGSAIPAAKRGKRKKKRQKNANDCIPTKLSLSDDAENMFSRGKSENNRPSTVVSKTVASPVRKRKKAVDKDFQCLKEEVALKWSDLAKQLTDRNNGSENVSFLNSKQLNKGKSGKKISDEVVKMENWEPSNQNVVNTSNDGARGGDRTFSFSQNDGQIMPSKKSKKEKKALSSFLKQSDETQGIESKKGQQQSVKRKRKNTKNYLSLKEEHKNRTQLLEELTTNRKSLLTNPEEAQNETGKSEKMKRKMKKDLKSVEDQDNNTNLMEQSEQEKCTSPQIVTKSTEDKNKMNREWKKHRFRLKRLEKRKEMGLILLPDKEERKLRALRKALQKSGKPNEDVKNILRKERRKHELSYRKQQDMICFRCRKRGHTVSDCRAVLGDSQQSMGICFRCGSTEHILKRCPQPAGKGNLAYAKCFVCNDRGHLSSTCPKNSRGVFPKGGACTLCRSVNHMRKDCPTVAKEKDEPKTFVHRVTNIGSVDADIWMDEVKTAKIKKATRKVITF